MRYLIILFLVTSVFAQNDFRTANWGDSKALVKQKEKKKLLIERENDIMYEDSMLGFSTYVVYYFNQDGKLYQGLYSFDVSHISPDLYFDDYDKIKQNIAKKYGIGTDKDSWKDDLFKDSPGTALTMGYYRKACTWTTEKSTLILGLSGDNLKVGLMLIYTSRTVGNEEKSAF